MATTIGPDLDFAREQVEALMDDTCRIERPSPAAPTMDPDTLKLVPAAPTVVYEGPLTIVPRAHAGTIVVETEGGDQVFPQFYEVSIPADSPLPVKGDQLFMTSSRRDLPSVGEDFRVREVPFNTFLVSRRLVVELHGT